MKNEDGAAISDEERRKNAEAMMFKLSAMMDIGLDEGEGDDSEEEGNNEETAIAVKRQKLESLFDFAD